MINTNSALYLGILQACVLERCPSATLLAKRLEGNVNRGYEVTGMIKVGEGSGARSFASVHSFLDHETNAQTPRLLTEAARLAGDDMGAILASAK